MTVGLNMDIESFLSLIFLVVFVFYAIYSGFFIYHWYAFGIKKTINSVTTIVYLTGSGLMLLVMALAIFSL